MYTLTALLAGFFVILKDLHRERAVFGFLLACFPAMGLAALIVMLVLPPRYSIKPGQVQRLFQDR